MKNGFFYDTVEENSRKYTSFVNHEGQYQFLKVPFGLCNSPAVFQRFIDCIFKDLIQKGTTLQYMDDLIIPARNDNEAIQKLKIVVERASEYGLEIYKKCQFVKTTVEFLGHRIEDGKLYTSTEKNESCNEIS